VPAIPYAQPGFFSPSAAAFIAKRARKALRAGELTPHHFAVLETLLWDARKPGSDRAVASLGWLQKLARVCRQTAVDAIKAGVRLGLLRKIKHKTLTLWANGGRQWRQRPNEYVFHCESTAQTEYPKQVIQILSVEVSSAEIAAAQAALASRQRMMGRKFADEGSGKRPGSPAGGV
jgi:hypothetical protein